MTTTDLIGAPALATATGLSFRQIDYWTRTGRLRSISGGGHGHPRHYPAGEVHVAQTASRLIAAGFTVEAALEIARKFSTATTVNLAAGFWLADLTTTEVGQP